MLIFITTLKLLVFSFSFHKMCCKDLFVNLKLDAGVYKVNIGEGFLTVGSVQIKVEHSFEVLSEIKKAIEVSSENFDQVCKILFKDKPAYHLLCESNKNEYEVLTKKLKETINELILQERNEKYSIDNEENMVFRSSVITNEDDFSIMSMGFLKERPVNQSVTNNIKIALYKYKITLNYYEHIQYEAIKRNKGKISIALQATKKKLKNGFVSKILVK